MKKVNDWVWTRKAEAKIPSRKEGQPVPIGFLMEGFGEYFPRQSWVQKGYVKKRGE